MVNLLSNIKLSNRRSNGGFTLIELMITISIFVFMTALILAKYNSYYSGTLFNNIAYDIALSIRQAQNYGISVKINDDPNDKSFNRAYGVWFPGSGSSSSNNIFGIFKYDNTLNWANSVVEKEYRLKHGATFKSFKVLYGGSDVAVDNLEIIFQRPDPEAIINGAKDGTVYQKVNSVTITLLAVDGVTTKEITVNSSGMISIGD